MKTPAKVQSDKQGRVSAERLWAVPNYEARDLRVYRFIGPAVTVSVSLLHFLVQKFLQVS